MTYLLSRNSKLCSLSMIKTSLHVGEVLLLPGWLLYKISNIIAARQCDSVFYIQLV